MAKASFLDEANYQVRDATRASRGDAAGSFEVPIFPVTSPRRPAATATFGPPAAYGLAAPTVGRHRELARAGGPVSQTSRGPTREGPLVSLSANLHHGRVLWSG